MEYLIQLSAIPVIYSSIITAITVSYKDINSNSGHGNYNYTRVR